MLWQVLEFEGVRCTVDRSKDGYLAITKSDHRPGRCGCAVGVLPKQHRRLDRRRNLRWRHHRSGRSDRIVFVLLCFDGSFDELRGLRGFVRYTCRLDARKRFEHVDRLIKLSRLIEFKQHIKFGRLIEFKQCIKFDGLIERDGLIELDRLIDLFVGFPHEQRLIERFVYNRQLNWQCARRWARFARRGFHLAAVACPLASRGRSSRSCRWWLYIDLEG